MNCPFCNNKMTYVRHFEKGKNYGFHQCTKCCFVTHHKRLHFDDDEIVISSNNAKIEKNQKTPLKIRGKYA